MTRYHMKEFGMIQQDAESAKKYRNEFDDIFYKACPDCEGIGTIHTDRGDEGQWYHPCDRCEGRGKVSKREEK